MPKNNVHETDLEIRESQNHLDFILDEDLIIFVVGAGKTGLRTVGKMVNGVSSGNCIGLRLPSDDCNNSNDLSMIPLAGSYPDQHLDIERLIGITGESDLVFLVASLDEGLNDLLLDICSAINEKSIRLILVTPEPQDGYESLKTLIDAFSKVGGVILVSENPLNTFDLIATYVPSGAIFHRVT